MNIKVIKHEAKWLAAKAVAFAIAFLVLSACTAFSYGKALDACAINHQGDRAGTFACQCDVAKQNGRSCDFLPDSGDAGVVSPDTKDAGGQ